MAAADPLGPGLLIKDHLLLDLGPVLEPTHTQMHTHRRTAGPVKAVCCFVSLCDHLFVCVCVCVIVPPRARRLEVTLPLPVCTLGEIMAAEATSSFLRRLKSAFSVLLKPQAGRSDDAFETVHASRKLVLRRLT